VFHIAAAGNLAQRVAPVAALDRILLLMWRHLRLAAHPIMFV
jgi:hypothetical protein